MGSLMGTLMGSTSGSLDPARGGLDRRSRARPAEQ
eukprot:gene5122-biopygen5637